MNNNLNLILSVIFITSCSTSSDFISDYENTSIFQSKKNISMFDGGPILEIKNLELKDLAKINSTNTFTPFNEIFAVPNNNELLKVGDIVTIYIWESSPAMLFGQSMGVLNGEESKSYSEIPVQSINSKGFIQIPFLGDINILNKTIQQAEEYIEQELQPLANSPQVMITLNKSSNKKVTMIGDFKKNDNYDLRPGNNRLLDIISDAGGVNGKINEVSITITRKNQKHTLPLSHILDNPLENIMLQYGDIVSSKINPNKFIALGAINSNTDISFKLDKISLANGLALVNGWQDVRADVSNVYVLRSFTKETSNQPNYIIYSFNLDSAEGLIIASKFLLEDDDVLYIADNKSYEIQKFLNLIGSVVNPITGFLNVERITQ